MRNENGANETALSKIDGLVGVREFKRLVHELHSVAPLVKKHSAFDIFSYRCYLFSICKGGGLSTVLELFAKLLSEEGLFEIAPSRAVRELMLPPPSDMNGELSELVPELGHGHVICIDIGEWIDDLASGRFKRFLACIEDFSTDNIIVFRVPFLEDDALEAIRARLGDILTVTSVTFEPFCRDELRQCAAQSLKNAEYTMDTGAWEIFDLLCEREKADGSFYGINTVNKLVREMIYAKQVYDAANCADDCVIKREELSSLRNAEYDERSGEEILNSMIGMEQVTKRLSEIVVQIEAARKRGIDPPCIHMRFVGNPGTGKTTVARALGKILKDRGVLANGAFFERSAKDLCGKYVGQTAPKTAEMCRDAYGSVLFIDEAYSLYKGGGDGNADSFGREAIDTLLSEMENHRKELVVIMAGYPNEMDVLMQANPGLESRMPYVLEFPNYTRSALADIFISFCEGKFDVGADLYPTVREYFDLLPESVIESEKFSNARFVRNLFERTWGKATMRSRLEGSDNVVIGKEDFRLATSDREFELMMKKKIKSVGFN